MGVWRSRGVTRETPRGRRRPHRGRRPHSVPLDRAAAHYDKALFTTASLPAGLGQSLMRCQDSG